MKPKTNALVIYKSAPAKVVNVGDKIDIVTESGKKQSVREKDIQVLHVGPFEQFGELKHLDGDVEGAWELLSGESTTLEELAELVFGEFNPNTAWNSWCLIQDGTWFHGDLDAVDVRSKQEIDAIREKVAEKAKIEEDWQAHLKRIKSGEIAADDEKYLQDIERLAYGEIPSNRTLNALGMPQTPEKAHELLLKLGVWSETTNPYPKRFHLEVRSSNLPVSEPEAVEREDLTHLHTVAIDDEGCQDPDDAISLDSDGSLWVHVADVATLVAPDSELDREARVRGSNLYLPELTSNMLPDEVTMRLGLGLTSQSPALSVKLRLDDNGDAVCEKITHSLIKVTRHSYSDAESLIDSSPFSEIAAVTDRFHQKRLRRDAAMIDLPEVKIRVENDDIVIKPLPRLRSREMVTDAMLMAGEAVAKFAYDNGIPIPYATQEPPETIENPRTPSDMFAYRKQFKRTEQHTIPSPHFGLGVEIYTRMTSPLRRYADLLVHQQLNAYLKNVPLISEDDLSRRLAESEQGASAASTVERFSNRHWTLLYVERQTDWRARAILVDKRDNRGTVIIPELALDVKVRDVGKYDLDSEFEVSLNRINLPTLDIYLAK